MSTKLSPSLKALINAPLARPGQTPAPPRIKELYQQIAREARERQYGVRPWLALSVRPPPKRSPPLTPSPPSGSSNIYPQLARLPPLPPPNRLLVTLPPHPPRSRRVHPRGWPQVHLLQRHPAHHQRARRLPRGPRPRPRRPARDAALARPHAVQPPRSAGARPRALGERLPPAGQEARG